VAYDEPLAQRIRELLATERGVAEKRMFGGLAFLVKGNMAVAASGQGDMLLRVDPDDGARYAESAGVEPMVMRGKRMAAGCVWTRRCCVRNGTSSAG